MTATARYDVHKSGQGIEPWVVKRSDPIAGLVKVATFRRGQEALDYVRARLDAARKRGAAA